LKSDPGISEFLKDTSAIANTVGLDGFLIFGYDPQKDQYHQVSFKDSNLRNQNEIRGFLIKSLSDPFDIELYSIPVNGQHRDVLHIPPPSINKPYLIKQHRTYYSDRNLKLWEKIEYWCVRMEVYIRVQSTILFLCTMTGKTLRQNTKHSFEQNFL
jgi:hypothetical protein